MKEWIYVESISKAPLIRTGTSPFEKYADGFDPNHSGTPYGPGHSTMFVPVVRPDPPAYNEVTEELTVVETTVGDFTVEGQYVSPDWVVDWLTVPNSLENAREAKGEQLNADYQAATDAGYEVGPYVFPLTEAFFQRLHVRLNWMDEAIAAGVITPDREITFTDQNGKEVRGNVNQLRTHFANFGYEYIRNAEVVVRAVDRITAATTVEEVDAVSWTFL